jgi:hypothetical protein
MDERTCPSSNANYQDAEKACQQQFETREAYLVKRRSFSDSDVSRFTNDVAGLFEHPARVPSYALDCKPAKS